MNTTITNLTAEIKRYIAFDHSLESAAKQVDALTNNRHTAAINKIKSTFVDTSDFPELKRTFKYKKSTVIKANDLNL